MICRVVHNRHNQIAAVKRYTALAASMICRLRSFLRWPLRNQCTQLPTERKALKAFDHLTLIVNARDLGEASMKHHLVHKSVCSQMSQLCEALAGSTVTLCLGNNVVIP